MGCSVAGGWRNSNRKQLQQTLMDFEELWTVQQ
jgi:hypothetical protein